MGGQATATRTEVGQSYTKGMIGNIATTDPDFTTSLSKARFGVFAYYTGVTDYASASSTGTWRTETSAEKYPNFMYNQQLIYNDAGYWTYDPVKYWPNGNDAANAANTPSNTAQAEKEGKLSFYAFAPYTAATTTAYSGTVPDDVSSNGVSAAKTMTTGKSNGVTAITGNDCPSNVWVKYLMPNAQVDEAVDLLWGVRGSYQYKETDNGNNPPTALTSLDGNTYNINLTKQIVKASSTNEKVKFLFKHALSKIGGQTVATENVSNAPASTDKVGFMVVADIDVNTAGSAGDHDDQAAYLGSNFDASKTLITLKAVKIQDGKSASDDTDIAKVTGKNSNIFNSGWFNIETGTWKGGAVETTGATVKIIAKSDDANQSVTNDANYSINPLIREVASYSKSDGSGVKKLASGGATWAEGNPTGVTTTAQAVFASENIPGLLLIPGSTAQTLYITVDYLVRTADANLAKGYTEVEQVITNEVNISSLSPNKYYTIIMHLGMTSVKFEAKVADWETHNGGTFDENGTYTPGSTATVNEQDVWLPSNVVK